MELLHKAIDFQVREVGDPADRILEFVGSTADVDRYGDIIEVEGWDLKNFKKNSPFLWAHNYQASSGWHGGQGIYVTRGV